MRQTGSPGRGDFRVPALPEPDLNPREKGGSHDSVGTRLAGVLTLLLATGFLQSSRGSLQVGDNRNLGRTLRGEIRLTPAGHPFENANVIVTVENITAQDAPSRKVGQIRLKNVSYDGRPNSVIPFTMKDLNPPPGSNCRVRVLVDLDRNDRISDGDYRTTKATPVFTEKDTDPLVVEAELKKKE